MKNLVLILLCFFSLIESYGQLLEETILDGNTFQKSYRMEPIKSIDQYIELNQAPSIEKIFLHLDRSDYMQGDTIWFKVYSWVGSDQVPDTLSKIMYVDLVSDDGKTRLKRKLLIENGTSRGDFVLDTILTPGSYSLRAYTRWIQNGNTGEPFYQTIRISPLRESFQVECKPVIIKQPGSDSLKINFRFFEVSPTGDLRNTATHNISCSVKVGDRVLLSENVEAENTRRESIKCSLAGMVSSDTLAIFDLSVLEKDLTYKKQFKIPLREVIDLQFFPEGGKMVNGIESRVAFKAIGTDGLGREIKGQIETGEEEVATDFESLHKGMGFFVLKPEQGKKYFADIWYSGRNYLIPLPEAKDDGVVMTAGLEADDNKLPLILRQSPKTEAAEKYVVGSAYGKVWFWGSANLKNDSAKIQVPLDLLPQGVCRLTVLNKDFKPECERLIYVDKNEDIKIEIESDSVSYGRRSKVTLQVKTTDSEGEPVQSELSLAVVDRQQVSNEAQKSGISFYKLVESELKGYIEDPSCYFKEGRCTNRKELDLLMLTQGYREVLPDTAGLKFQPERSFDVRGKIRADGSKSRTEKYNYRDVGLTLLSGSAIPYFNLVNSDSLGRFAFQVPLQYGSLKSILKATRDGKRPFYGEIAVDEPFMPNLSSPLHLNSNIALPVTESVQRLQAARRSQLKTIDLPEVTVKARAKNWYHDLETRSKKIMDLDSIDPYGNKYKDIFDLLVREYGAKWCPYPQLRTILLRSYRTVGPSLVDFFPIYVIDGHVYWNGEDGDLSPLKHLAAYDVNQIKRIMVIPPEKLPIEYAAHIIYVNGSIYQSTVVIETYGSAFYRGQKTGMKTFILDGLDTPRKFYSPQYEGILKESEKYDGRATLYWAPSVKTDSAGQAKVEFYTGDRQTSLSVIVNGMEVSSGRVGETRVELGITE